MLDDNKHELIETLIENIANLLVKFKVEYITISISKPGAIRDSEDVGITITRSKKSPT
jgi:dihydroneopterin aldolase